MKTFDARKQYKYAAFCGNWFLKEIWWKENWRLLLSKMNYSVQMSQEDFQLETYLKKIYLQNYVIEKFKLFSHHTDYGFPMGTICGQRVVVHYIFDIQTDFLTNLF